MLGADGRFLKKDWGRRNHFATWEGSQDCNDLRGLEKLGMVREGSKFEDVVFWATKKGAVAIGFKPYQLRKTKLAQ